MSMLFNIIYATKANGSHHKLAMDALNNLEVEQARNWRRLFLKYVDVYLEGSKAPDKEFKDFKNHVLHVGDSFWGGAPDKAGIWYEKLVRSLQDEQFEEAVYCAGVLSHYYTDPIQPFHTAQSEAENNMHRAVEWSINKSYNILRKRGETHYRGLLVEPGEGSEWVQDMVRRGAMRSHQYYEPLISNYNLDRGVVEPVEGLNENCHRFLSELIIYASTGFARMLDRAIMEAAVKPPVVNLSIDTFVASLGIPLRWVLRKLDDAEQRRAVQAAYDELQQTGTVEKNLSEDDRMVRALHKREVLENRTINRQENLLAKRKSERLQRQKEKQAARRKAGPATADINNERKTPVVNIAEKSTPVETAAATVAVQPITVSKAKLAPVVNFADNSKPAPKPAPASKLTLVSKPEVEAPKAAAHQVEDKIEIEKAAATTDAKPVREQKAAPVRVPRYLLALEDDVEQGPSIGKKTAARFYKVGVNTVAELLAADVEDLAAKIDARWIGAKTIRDWQDQARLCVEVAEMRGGNSQVLVASGLRTTRAIAELSPTEVQAMMNLFCQTKEGQNMRACESLPALSRIEIWVETAKKSPHIAAA